MTATASVEFGQDGPAVVKSYLRLTASTHIMCCTYDHAAPILAIHDGQADITITNPGRGQVTEDDVAFGHLLADAAARYAAELDRLAAKTRATAGPDAGGQAA